MARGTDLAGDPGDLVGAIGHGGPVSVGAWSWLRIFPWMRSVLANYETANFAELLALLLEHQVPYPAALKLAAESTGDRRLIGRVGQMAAAVERGESPATAVEAIDRRTFLPMLRWVLSTGQEQGSTVARSRTWQTSIANGRSIKPSASRCFSRQS